MKLAICLATSFALCASSAIANPALAPGKPAGVHHAQGLDTNTTMIIAGVGLAAIGIAIAASAGNAGGPTTSTTNSTSTTTSTSTTS